MSKKKIVKKTRCFRILLENMTLLHSKKNRNKNKKMSKKLKMTMKANKKTKEKFQQTLMK